MGINFPSAPVVGDIYPTPAVAGVPQYRWDGIAWLASTQADAQPASVIVSDTPPASPRDNWFWWESDTGTLHLRYNDGVGPPQWVQAAGQSTIDTSQFALFDAMAVSGMQVNGGFDVDQANGGASIAIPAGAYSVPLMDCWRMQKTAGVTAAFTIQQVASVFPGYGNELKLTVTTAQAAPGSENFQIYHNIEGYRLNKLGWGTANAQPLTVGFWVKSSVAGNMFMQVHDSVTLSNNQIVNIAAANTPQFITVTFPAQTSWGGSKTNGSGLRLSMFLLFSTYLNIAATIGNTFEITGVIALPGSQAPTAAQSPLIMRPYGQELATCQRYWQRLGGVNQSLFVDSYSNTQNLLTMVLTHPTMRSLPTWAFVGSSSSANVTTIVPTIMADLSNATLYWPAAGAGRLYWHVNPGSYFTLDARL